ncbi:MAG TPA: ATP synthase F0 subunit B [Pyrinomonadaceae bacterium]|nr:ATP synthase F0 subunit B [Pyrinomonadaceae bacterium]
MIILGLAGNSIQLVPDGTIFLHIAIIIFMIYVLNATLFRPVNRVLAERERRTRGGTGEAQDILQRVADSMNRYERSLRDARTEGYRLLEQERAKALEERQNQLNSLRAEIETATEEQKSLLRTQSEQARASLEKDARRIASDISSQILNRPSHDFTTTGVR